MEKFEKCTVAMLGGPCSQHVMGNTSRLNQPQSAIISHNAVDIFVYTPMYVFGWSLHTEGLLSSGYATTHHGINATLFIIPLVIFPLHLSEVI